MSATTPYPVGYKAWLAKVISYDTTSHKSNIALMDYIKGYLQSVGITSTYTYNPEKTKANLFATLPGANGATQGGIVLSGHVDVVPVDGQQWDTDPFTVVEKDGKLYGRGTCDMKGFIAVTLALTPQFLTMKDRVKPIHYAFSFDEELGCAGVPYMTNALKAQGFKADCCIVGEGSIAMCAGSKGFKSWTVKVQGKAIHSSMALMNTSCNAIEYAAMIITKIRAIAEDLKKSGPQDKLYNCPFCAMSVGVIKGGNAVNTVPAECEFDFSIRIVNNAAWRAVEKQVQAYIDTTIIPAMKAEHADSTVTMTPAWYVPAFNANEQHGFVKMIRAILKDHEVRKGAGGTEAGYFEEDLGIPTVIIGPGGNNAHLANEHTTTAQMERYTAFLYEAVGKATGSSSAATPKL